MQSIIVTCFMRSKVGIESCSISLNSRWFNVDIAYSSFIFLCYVAQLQPIRLDANKIEAKTKLKLREQGKFPVVVCFISNGLS